MPHLLAKGSWLDSIPALYATEGIKIKDKKIHAHFFVGACDWYITEYDPVSDQFFGYAILGDPEMAEWGYISRAELESVRVSSLFEVERDLHWDIVPAGEVQKIVEANGIF